MLQNISNRQRDIQMEELLNGAAINMAEAIRCKKMSSLDLVHAHLARIAKINPKINAVVQVDSERAIQQARQMDKLLSKGFLMGPFHGVPFTAKDVYSTAGVITTLGTLGMQHYTPKEDASLIQRIKNSGAILLGKTNVSELCTAAETANLVYGETLNPYDLTRTPGGSSGGEAAIIAAAGSPFGIGSDLGGSLRIPAHYCGIACLRPTVGRVALSKDIIGSNPFGIRTGSEALLAVDGPMARHVEDLYAIMRVISGPDGVDPYAIDLPLYDPLEIDIEQLTIGYFIDNGVMTPTEEIATCIQQTIESLRASGAQLVEKQPDFMLESLDIMIQLSAAGNVPEAVEAALLSFNTKQPSDLLIKFLDRLRRESHKYHDFRVAWAAWDCYRSKLTQYMHELDVIISPVLPFSATKKHMSLWDESLFPALSYCFGFSLLQLPVATVRVGEDKHGLPIGVQIVCKPWREDVALAVAKNIEDRFGGWKPAKIDKIAGGAQ